MALSPIKENQIYAHKPYVIMSPEGQAVNGGRMVLHAGDKAECEDLADRLYSGRDCPVQKREYDLADNDNTVLEIDPPCTMKYGQIIEAKKEAILAEKEAESWLHIARMTAGHELFDTRIEQYQIAAERAIKARIEWLNVRNDFESGK